MRVHIAPLLTQIPAIGTRRVKISELSGGITNRNYRVDTDSDSFVVRLSDKSTALLGIHRGYEARSSKAAAKTGVGAEVIYFKRSPDILATRFIQGKPVQAGEVAGVKMLPRVVDSIRRFHRGPKFPGRFSPFTVVKRYYREALKRKVKFPAGFQAHLQTMDAIRRALKTSRLVPCHNDLLAGNFIDDGKRIRIIDWEYAAMGDLFFDLGNLSANCEFDDEADRRLVKLYFGKMDESRLSRVKLMKAASAMREAMWGFLQSGISKLDFDFKDYALSNLNRFIRHSSEFP